jgi:cysteinyl-tRNA synthetase
MLKLYNTLTRKKEKFIPLKDKSVGIYTCGPTVYWFAHIGNFRSFIFPDVLKRVLVYNGYKVRHVINVTDVGHLSSDADEGEDKVEEAAKKEGKSASDVSKFYFDAYRRDFKKLNLIEPDFWPKASEHISEQIEMIRQLEKKGFVYKSSDGIYFDSSKFKDYGKLSNKKVEGLEAGKRVSLGEKKHVTDFALWKFSSSQNGKRQQEWDSPFGVGFPGWHIECSAMASKYLGKQFDIHTGGEDHMHIHHENEIAQSEGVFGKKPWVRYWMHGAFLNSVGGKMGKAFGNDKSIGELEKEGFSPMMYKYFTYSAHYRRPLKLSEDGLEGAREGYAKLLEIVARLIRFDKDKKINPRYLRKFEERINDDLDMPGAVSVLWGLLRDKSAKGKLETVKKMDKIFGLKLVQELSEEDKKAIKRIEEARKNKDYPSSDKERKALESRGWKVTDTPEGTYASAAIVIPKSQLKK